MQNWMRSTLQKFRYRLTHTAKFPKGDLVSFLLNVAQRGFEPTHIIDVGANQGKWSRKAARIFPDCRFTLVEPQREMHAMLDQFCERNQHAKWIQAGVADKAGELPLTVNPDRVSSTFTLSREEANVLGFEQRPVPVTTLDQIVRDSTFGIPQLVKVDAEGFECRILEGANSLVGETELFLLEVPLVDAPRNWNSFAEIVDFMAQRDYVPYDFTSFQKRPVDGAVGLCEVAFARKNGQLRAFAGWNRAA